MGLQQGRGQDIGITSTSSFVAASAPCVGQCKCRHPMYRLCGYRGLIVQ